MKLLLTISIITSISAIRVPSSWQPQPNGNTNNNNVFRDNRPVRQDTFVQPTSSFNNVPFGNNIPTVASNGLLASGSLRSNSPTNYNNWFPGAGASTNGFAFNSPTNQLNSGNLFGTNPFIDNGNEIVKKPYVQRQGPPRLIQTPHNFHRRPVSPIIPNPATYKELPSKIPYITYTTQASQNNNAAGTANSTPGSDQSINIKQAYPQVTSPKNVIPLTDLDFSPRNPFPSNQEDGQASTQINNPTTHFSTIQPVNTLDFSLNNPFPQNQFVNGYPITQIPQLQSPFVSEVGSRIPKYNSIGGSQNAAFNPFNKNYRDHRTHEPTDFEPHYDRTAIPVVERLENEKAPIVENHEHPAEVPTKPIYPGEGQWAKPGLKHRPYVSNQQYTNLEESNETPDGYDTFLQGQKLFEDQKRQFGDKLQTSAPVKQISTEGVTQETETFVPTRLYAQVRHSEDEKHLPPESDENGRLKELIKDTKIQTIYSEEGFEDSAYDHAGHEKKAENNEQFESDEKNKEIKGEKKTPVQNVNRQSSSYSVGDPDLKKEDIEKIKENELRLDDENEDKKSDSEPAGTHFVEQPSINKVKPPKDADEFKKGSPKSHIQSKEVKTVTAKDKRGGNIEMEISSEVKAIVQPNNTTKFHKYIKIYPKFNKNPKSKTIKEKTKALGLSEDKADKRSFTLEPHEIFIEEHKDSNNTTEYLSTTVTPTEYAAVVTMEIPTSTQATTAIPKLNANPYSSETVRRKRSPEGVPDIEIDTDFIDKINHDIGQPVKKSKGPDENKYPYYNSYKEKGLHENSPLRYSEDLKTVPQKTGGKLAFYEQADRKMACSDVNPEVDPVPDRIKNADESIEDEEEDDENDPATKGPRLGQLGDKIDCFKAKYFGENPLDNPLFQEKLVGPVSTIFSEIESISTKKLGDKKSDSANGRTNSKTLQPDSNQSIKRKANNEKLGVAASNYDPENEIDKPSKYTRSLTGWFPGKIFGLGENTERDSKFVNNFVESNSNPTVNLIADNIKSKDSKPAEKEVQTLPPATLITTPKYTIKLKPKHIYDQIQLLEYLPEYEFDEIRKEIRAEIPKINKTDVATPIKNKIENVSKPSELKNKKKTDKKVSLRKAKTLKDAEESMRMETSDNGNPESLPEDKVLQLIRPKPNRPMYQIFDINRYIPKVPKITFPVKVPSPDPYRFAPIPIIKPTYEIFDVNKFLPSTPLPALDDFMERSTALPKLKVISEVFYKEDIKPNEQLNVFTDVINNIQNFPMMKDNFPESSQPESIKLNTEKVLEKYPQTFVKETDGNNNDYYSSTTTTITTTFNPETHASNHKYSQADEAAVTEKQAVNNTSINRKTKKKPKRRRRIKTTTPETSMVIEESTSTLQFVGKPVEVMGLMPPVINGYKTIYHPKRDSSQQLATPTIRIEERKINRYFVQGMRPPPKQKVFLYSDFLTDNHIGPKITKRQRHKRSAQRPAYSQVDRNKNNDSDTKAETKKEEDDYVPNRTRNYHYDEKTGKIVYDKKPQQQSEEEEEEVEYVEVVQATPQTTAKPKQSPIFATATPPPEGQSYVDFVKLLKSATNYKEIPDPTTTEKGAEEVTQKLTASTLQPVSTSPPEFLSILAKVRNDSNYKLIEDKKKTTSKPTEAVEEEEAESSEDEESQVDDVRNSPGGQGYESGNTDFGIFDISDFLPNIKSYLPKTAVDTSKYKTIERPQLRHSLSSRYNSEQDKDLQNINTSKQPIFSNSDITENPTNGAGQEVANEKVEISPRGYSKTTTSAPEVTTRKIIRTPSRRRTTTARPVASEEPADSSQVPVTTSEPEETQHNKPRRNHRRRQKRIRIQPATENSSITDDTTRAVRRRSERESHLYADGTEQTAETEFDASNPSARGEDYADYEVPHVSNNTETKHLENITEVAKQVVEVFKNYDKSQKHGGNYKKEDEINKAKRIDVIPVTEDQEKVKDSVEVFKNYDKSKKHGGNYKKEDEVNKGGQTDVTGSQEKVKEFVKVFKDYEKTRKTGGNYKSESEITEKPVTLAPLNVDPKDIKKVEVFKDYDKSKKHGGNYKPFKEDVLSNAQDGSELEKTESIQVKNVNIFQDYDKTKKHGGDYKAEDDALRLSSPETESKPVLLKNIEVFKDYDKSKKHGGNYKAEDDSLKLSSPNTESESVLLKNIEVFKDYDKTKKHGGNYKEEDNLQVKEQLLRESQYALPQSSQNALNTVAEKRSVDVFKDYDKSKKHGGNYIQENEGAEKHSKSKEHFIHTPNDVEILKDYNEEKKTGGNYKHEDETTEPAVDESHYPNTTPQSRNYLENRNDVQRLTDVVLKPETFYSDIKLPVDINALKIVEDLPHEEIEEIADSADIDDSEKDNKEETLRRIDSPAVTTVRIPAFTTIGGKTRLYPVTTASSVTKETTESTKKPLIIKDPSKRLYFYAPVR